jgi:ion channel-forming bestrophin family protein
MIIRPHLHWFRLLFVWRGSVLPYIISRLALVFAVSVLSVLNLDRWMSAHAASALSIPPFTLMGVALAIFLGFRNSVSYDRYWEARKQWGALLIGARSVTREISSFAPEATALQRRVALTLSAFAFALKHQLRGTDPRNDLACRLDTAVLERVCAARFVPPALLLCLAQDFGTAQKAGVISDLQLQSLDCNLNLLTETSSACERIANTPIPYTYRVLMNRTVMVYCLLLPVGLSTSIGWVTILVAPFIAYTFLALDVIGEQIEEPFGKEPNDLALASMCHVIEVSVCELVGETPRSSPPEVINYVVT